MLFGSSIFSLLFQSHPQCKVYRRAALRLQRNESERCKQVSFGLSKILPLVIKQTQKIMRPPFGRILTEHIFQRNSTAIILLSLIMRETGGKLRVCRGATG